MLVSGAQQSDSVMCVCVSIYSFTVPFFVVVVFLELLPEAHGGSQARGQIRVVAVGLHHSHSNSGSKPCLQPTPYTAHGNARSLTH